MGMRWTPRGCKELMAKVAAVNALVIAGMALRPGVGSVSLSRDGVSESVSYTTTAQYGAYTGTITAYKEWIQEETARFRARYKGVTMIIV